MVQKAVRSEASSPNSLGPKRDWPEVRGEEYRPRTVLSWLLAKWVVRRQGVAHCRPMDLRTRKKRKLLFLWESGGTETKWNRRFSSRPSTGGRSGAVLAVSWERANSNISGLPASGPLRRLPGRLGAWQGRGGPCSPVRGSMRRPMCRFSLGRSSSGGRRRAPTATGRLRGAPGAAVDGASRRGRMCWITSVCCCTAEYCWAKCLARSTVSFGRESGCQFTGLGRETRTVPPSGGVSWAQVHCDRSLHLGNACVPPGHSAVEGSEDGGGRRAASGRERGHPWLRQLLRHRSRAWLWAAPRSEKPIVQPRGLVTGRAVCWPPARYSRLPGQAWPSAPGPVRRWRQHPRGAAPPLLHPRRTWTHPPMLQSTSYPQMAHRMKSWAPHGTDQRNHPGTGRDVRCVRSKRSVGMSPAERLLQ